MDFSNITVVGSISRLNKTGPFWRYVPIVTICTGILTLILNGVVLSVLLRRENSALPFSLYLINLFSANILFVILGNPLDIVNTLYREWLPGWHWCTLYLYAYNVVACGVVSSLALITINHLWATAFPVHYRIHNSHRTASLLIVGMWTYAHICLGSGILIDALYYRLPAKTHGCTLNYTIPRMYYWGITTQWVNFNLPTVFMAVAYFYILHKVIHRRPVHCKERSPGDIYSESRRPSETEVPGIKTPEICTRGGNGCRQKEKSVMMRRRFLILTLLTWSNFINLMPSQVYSTMTFYVDAKNHRTLWRVTVIMLSANAALNPILFGLSLDTVKDSMGRIVRSLRRRVRPTGNN